MDDNQSLGLYWVAHTVGAAFKSRCRPTRISLLFRNTGAQDVWNFLDIQLRWRLFHGRVAKEAFWHILTLFNSGAFVPVTKFVELAL